jgi:hypothetical protein
MEIESSFSPRLLSDREVSTILLFCEVARENGAAIFLKDLSVLASTNCSEEDLANSWKDCELLSSRYEIVSGLVLEKTRSKNPVETRGKMDARRARANSNIIFANQLEKMFERGRALFEVLSISGSTSYLSVSETDDIDFFCMTKTGSMWGAFVRALLLARAFRLSRKDAPWICLSYVADETFVRKEFSEHQNGLFARDALSTLVIRGENRFLKLLRENGWMASYFPKLYGFRVNEAEDTPEQANSSGLLGKIMNLFLYYTAGSYIKLKSYLLNREFLRDRRFSSLFQLRIGPDHCIYESADYLRLKQLYASLGKNDLKSTGPE